MQLHIDSYGAYWGVQDGVFVVKPLEQEAVLLAPAKVKTIFLCKGARVSSDALALAIANEIPVFLVQKNGRVLGQMWSAAYGSVSTIRKHQALFAGHIQGLIWTKEVLIQKVRNQQTVLTNLEHQKCFETWQQQLAVSKGHEILEGVLAKFGNWQAEKDIRSLKEIGATFRGWEGSASKQYFFCLSQVLPKQYEFRKRHRRPAYDPFNAVINYLYGILYALVETSLIKAGIDPYVGVLHTDRYSKPTLVYDVIEYYRYWADEVALQVCLQQKVRLQEHFDKTDRDGLWLNGVGKKVLLGTFTEYMDTAVVQQNMKRKRYTHIDIDANRLATLFKFFSVT